MPTHSTERLRDRANLVRLPAGDLLFLEGEAADSAFVLRSGRVEIISGGSVIRTVRRGAVIGELALLTRSVRAASARALRDCELWQLSRADFEQLIVEDHRFALSLCRSLGAQLAEHRSPVTVVDPPRTVAMISLDRDISADDAADRLAGVLGAAGETTVLRADSGREVDDFAPIFDRAESCSRWVILSTAHGPEDRWTKACLSEADRIVALSRGHPAAVWMQDRPVLQGCELVVIGSTASQALLRAIAPRVVQTLPDESAMQRCLSLVARRLEGRAVGIVFSGGGARAFAHLGVIEELRAVGVRVDRAAGVSMGALVAGAVALEMDDAAMYDGFRRYFVEQNPSGDYTLPAYSLIRGRRTHRLLSDAFGAIRIEELPLRFFCMSADLNSRSPVIHRIGPVRDAIFASLAIPGVFPPVPTAEGHLLVDGGVLDNLPVETMARETEGPVIAVDVTRAEAWRPSHAGTRSSWRARAQSLISGQHQELPRLAETMLRTLAVGSRDTVASARRHADVVITPAVEHAGMLDWKQLPTMREAGRTAVRRLLEANPDALKACM